MKFKAIGFDYGGVIGGIGLLGPTYNERMCHILEVDLETFRKAYFSVNHLINLGEVKTWREFWKIFLNKIGKPQKLDELMAFSDENGKLLKKIDTKMLEFVDKLRSNGYKTGLLSNTTLEGGADMRRQKVDEHFDVFHISAETKLMKPDPACFAHFAKSLGVKINELVFVDDAEKSLSTAKECGFTPIMFTSLAQLKDELAKLSVRI